MKSPPDSRAEVGLGDLLVALERLQVADPAVAARIARCLGMADLPGPPVARPRGAWNPAHFRSDHPPPRPPPSLPRGLPELPPIEATPAAAGAALETWLEALDPVPGPPAPEWLRPVSAEPPAQPPPREPLLGRCTAAGVIAAAVATRRPGPDLDLYRLQELVVAARPLRSIPRLPTPTLQRGIQLLLDGGESMSAFLDDLSDLRTRCEQVVGRTRCASYSFGSDPQAAVSWRVDGSETTWRPEPGRPVLLATDLDMGARPAAEDWVSARTWRRFAQRCRSAGAPVVAFVPLQPSRWPRELAACMTLVHWDPRTTAAAVRRLVGPGHPVEP